MNIKSNKKGVCARCGRRIVPANESGWECFVDGKTTQPICVFCHAEDSEGGRKQEVGMCMSVAPGRIASMVPPDAATGYLKTPWCHLPKGHPGPHVCGDFRWGEEEDER